MGYESTFIFGIAIPSFTPDHDPAPYWLNDVARVDVSKMGGESRVTKLVDQARQEQVGERKFFYYADDGDTRVVEDRYGSPLIEVDLEELYKAVVLEDTESGYRRYGILHALAKQFLFDRDKWIELPDRYITVVHYGH